MAEATWYWSDGETRNGPVKPADLARLAAAGQLRSDHLVWNEGMADWKPAGQLAGLVKYLDRGAAAAGSVAVAAPAEAGGAVEPRPAALRLGEVACPHCGAGNPPVSQFCETCGMAMPLANPTGPRIVDHKGFATTSAGQRLQGNELQKQVKGASGALLAVAIIQTVVTAIIIGALRAAGHLSLDAAASNIVVLNSAVTAVLFWCLFVWARVQPLPASIVGVAMYATHVVINVVQVASLPPSNSTGTQNGFNGFNGFGISWLDIVILAVLGRAISAGLKYRRMAETAV